MHLTPRELDKLVLHGAGSVAQKRLARGLRLSYPEAVALIATVLLELIRDGRGVAELMDVGRQLLGHRQVMEGVGGLIHEVQVEGTFPDGTKLVTVHDPVARQDGDLALALYGSFLPVPELGAFRAEGAPVAPGAIETVGDPIELNEGRRTLEIDVVHRGDRPIQVGSHYPFADVNEALAFDREATVRMRLDIPAGTAVRFEPGESRSVQLVELARS
jgi:urease subunit gamma/beta